VAGSINNPEADPLVQRVLEVFSKDTDELVTEHKLIGFDLGKFRAWFKEDGGDPLMYNCYEVCEKDVDFLLAYLPDSVSFDFDKNAYFVSAYMETEDWVASYGAK
jgi:hypothetical protein